MKYYNLSDCVSIQRGLTFKKSDVVDNSDLRVLRSNNIDYDTYSFIDKDFSYLNPNIEIEDKYFTKKNDIIICMSTGSKKHLGKAALVSSNAKYVVGGFLAKIAANQEILSSKYLFYYLKNPKTINLIHSSVSSMTINNLRKDVLNNLQIPVPPLQEQEKIVERLDKSSSLVNQNIEIINKSLEKLIDTREGTINKLFNSFENFINWEEAATLVRGPFGGSLTKKMFVNEGYAVYEQRNAIGNNTKEFRYFVNKDKYLELKRFAVMGNDLIMSCSGTIGKVTKIDKDFKEGIINQALLKITPLNSEEIDFMVAWMSSKHFKDQLKTKGAAQKNIVSVKEIKKIKYPVAKKNQIDEIIKQVDRIKSISHELNKLYEMKLSLYKKLFQSLLQEDFNYE